MWNSIPRSIAFGYSASMQAALPLPKEIPLPFLVGALLGGHIMASMALLVLPALAPEVEGFS